MSDIDIIPAAASVDEDSVTNALDGVSTATVATDDKVIIQDTSDSDALKTVTAQSIANLGGGAPTIYTAAPETTSNITISRSWSNVAGGNLAPIPTNPLIASGVVITGTSDVVEVNAVVSGSTGGKYIGYRIDTGTPVVMTYDFSASQVVFNIKITGIAAGTYDFEFVAAGSWDLYKEDNAQKQLFQVTVFPG